MEEEDFLFESDRRSLDDEEFMPEVSSEDRGEAEARPAPGSRGLGGERGLGQHIGVNDRPHGPDFPVMGVPTISPAVFEAWLTARHSPALDEAPALTYYRAVLSKGVNPGVALAFYQHESQCGTDTAVIPAGTRNWGNLRPRTDGGLGRGVRRVSTSVGTFRGYNSWLDGLLDWCDLWSLAIYKGKSIREALKIYAPSDDGNNPHGYANTVLALLKQWDEQSGEFDLPGDDGTPAPSGALSDAPLLGPPSIPVEVFTRTLSEAGSPVLLEAPGADFFNLCVSSGVDPAVALAFFGQTSNYGTAGDAARRKNWGNLWDAQAKAVQTYGAWRESLADWLHRLQGPAYTANGQPTVGSIVPTYRGANAQNPDNATYTRQLLARLAALTGAPRDLGFVAGTRDLSRPAPPAPGPDTPVMSGPTISPALFAQVLEGYQSPALIDAPALDYYTAVMNTGINPALALAVFERESGCDTDPENPLVAAKAKNWGGLRINPNGAPGRAAGTVQTPAGAFRAYHSYMDSLLDWCDLLAGTFGGGTIGQALARYVVGESRGPNSYAQTVLRRLAEWAEASGPFDLPGDSRGLEAAPGVAPKWVGCSPQNFWVGRQGHTIIAVVNHEMQGTLDGTRQAFLDPSHGASAHYGIGRDGTILQFIKEEDTAWANGPIRNPNAAVVPWLADAQRNNTNPNRLTVTIEWEGSQVGKWHKVQFGNETFDTLDPTTIQTWFTPGDAQYQAGLALIRAICARYNIPTDRAHICRHSDVDSVTKWFCPGQGFPLQRLLDDLSGHAGGGAADDAPLLGTPTISVEAFTNALTAANSPALQEASGADYYNLCVSNGVDPAVALAFFGQTSNYGTAGDAASRKNWGSLWDSTANAVGTYGAWRESLADWLHRLQGPAYTAKGQPTVVSIVPIYRGANAQNPDNATYTSQLLARLGQLRGT
jgi:N-acetyl-anhydromuramyl-L-alanine amidase AmpD